MIDSLPSYHPDVRALADAELLATGALRPAMAFASPQDPGDGPTLLVPSSVASTVREAGGLLLVDEEGAPVAAIREARIEPAGTGGGYVVGTVETVGRAASGPFRRLYRAPSGSVEDPRPAAVVDRPLLAAETARVRDAATRDGSFTLLLRGAGPRVPLPVLVQSLLPLSRQDGVDLVVVPMASRPDDPGLQQRIDEQVARNYGLRLEEVCEPESAWGEVLRALDSDEGAADGPVDAEVWEILRWWRPERPARGLTVFFTGLSGSGKSTVARGLLDRLHETARTVTSVDGDVARRMLSAGLTFSRADRDLNIRRIGWVASEVTRHGGVAVCAPIAPFAATRADVRAMVEANGDFVLVHISTPLAECERRDRKGLYAKARRGEIPDFTGISSPYEEPTDAEITIDTTDISVDEAVERVLAYLVDGGWIAAD